MADLKEVRWVGRSREDLREFPSAVRREIGYALQFAQAGTKHPASKPLRGFGSGDVLEIVENRAGNAYRLVYTVRFPNAVYVLHAFQKKSKVGSKTPIKEFQLIRDRLRRAEQER